MRPAGAGPAPGARRVRGILLSLCLFSAAAAAAPGEALLPFADLRALAVEVRQPPEACVLHRNMEAVDELGWRLLQLPQVERAQSLPSLARTINRLFSEGSPKFAVLPRNQYTMVQAITPVPTSSRLLNADCSTLWVQLELKPAALRFTELQPGLLRRQVDTAAVAALERVLAAERRQPRPWSRVTLQDQGVIVAVAVTAHGASILGARELAVLREVTDEVFFAGGVDRSSVKSLFTPDVFWHDVENGTFVGGSVIDYKKGPASQAELQRRLEKSWNASGIITADQRSTLVAARLLMRDPKTGERVDPALALRLLNSELEVLRVRHGRWVQIDAAIILPGGDLPRETRY